MEDDGEEDGDRDGGGEGEREMKMKRMLLWMGYVSHLSHVVQCPSIIYVLFHSLFLILFLFSHLLLSPEPAPLPSATVRLNSSKRYSVFSDVLESAKQTEHARGKRFIGLPECHQSCPPIQIPILPHIKHRNKLRGIIRCRIS